MSMILGGIMDPASSIGNNYKKWDRKVYHSGLAVTKTSQKE
jgi:hypothetical protein